MNVLFRLSLCAAFLVVAWVALCLMNPLCIAELMTIPASYASLDSEEQRRRDLEELSAAVFRRVESKKALLVELTAGRRTLLDVAAEFRTLNELGPSFDRELLQIPYLGRTEPETRCREVITNVEMHYHDDPCFVAGATAELRRELDALLASGVLAGK
jgi:hypothetical protein